MGYIGERSFVCQTCYETNLEGIPPPDTQKGQETNWIQFHSSGNADGETPTGKKREMYINLSVCRRE